MTVVLLAGAGLLLRSYAQVLAVDPGFEAEGLLVAETVLPEARISERRPIATPSTGACSSACVRCPASKAPATRAMHRSCSRAGAPLVLVEGRPRPEPAEIVRSIASQSQREPGLS